MELILKPFLAVVLFGLIALPLSLWIGKFIPEGRIKRILFFKWRA